MAKQRLENMKGTQVVTIYASARSLPSFKNQCTLNSAEVVTLSTSAAPSTNTADIYYHLNIDQ
jgi:hypothetical protein